MINLNTVINQKFNRLTVLKYINYSINGQSRAYVTCDCECGKRVEIRWDTVKTGEVKSCGCFHLESVRKLGYRNRTHGMQGTVFYTCWQNMKSRCYYKKNDDYKNYGGRGIKVCKRWLNRFENFRDDMLPTWFSGATIDRIDPDGDYTLKNCQWLTMSDNAKKRHADRRVNQ